MKIKLALICLCLLLIVGCSKATQEPPKTPAAETMSTEIPASPLVAKIGTQTLTLDQLDASLQLPLYDLEFKKFELRRAQIIELMAKAGDDSKRVTELLLEPPTPPRVNLPKSHYPKFMVEPKDAVIRLSLFCSYQSSHCARLQPVLQSLQAQFNRVLETEFFDLPLGYHRYGKQAANAAHCAAQQGALFQYQASLYGHKDNLTDDRLQTLAQQLQLNMKAFTACLVEGRHLDKIHRDIEFANQIHIASAPTLFINGLYVKGPQTVELYTHYIEQELQRLSQTTPVPSYLPLALTGIEGLNERSDENTHLPLVHIRDLNDGSLTLLQTGDRLNESTHVEAIHAEHAILVHKKIRLRLPLTPDEIDSANPEATTTQTETRSRSEPAKDKVAALAMTLSRDWLDTQLLAQYKLEKHFAPAAHRVEGVHLLKLQDIDASEFFSVLGLRSGDVVLQVNDAFVHDEFNPLWQTLHQETDIDLLVMRQGLPIRYRFNIQ